MLHCLCKLNGLHAGLAGGCGFSLPSVMVVVHYSLLHKVYKALSIFLACVENHGEVRYKAYLKLNLQFLILIESELFLELSLSDIVSLPTDSHVSFNLGFSPM